MSNSQNSSGIFAEHDPLYEAISIATTPVKPGTKRPDGDGWAERRNLDQAARQALRQQYPDASIGVLAGTSTGLGNQFGFIDIDHPGLQEFIRRVVGPTVSKRGQKGSTLFCQFEQGLKSCKVRLKGGKAPVVEMMVDSGMTVIPPSIHPEGMPYQWEGKALHEVDPTELPLVNAAKLDFIKKVCAHPAAIEIAEGGPDIKAHDLMLTLTACGVAKLDLDPAWMAHCLNGLLPAGYTGNTTDETLQMLESARGKGLGTTSYTERGAYDPGELGPIPLGYVADGSFVFFEQSRRLLLTETTSRLITEGALLNLAPVEFWMEHYFTKKGIDTKKAGLALIDAARAKGGFDASRVRGRGVYIEGGQVVRNFGQEVPQSARYVYACLIPINIEPDGSGIDPNKVLGFLRLFNFASSSAAYLLFGWLVASPICGALSWRPHIFLTGAKNTGKTTVVNAMRSLLECLVVALDGQSTEAGIRQKLGPDSRPVILDEFESDQNLGRMRQIIKLVRSASSGDLTIARGTPEGKALEFMIRSSFLLAAINAIAVTAADRSRIVSLSLDKHNNDKAKARQIAEASQQFVGKSAGWCLRAMDLTTEILASIETLRRVFPPVDSRHALNMSTLLGAAWTMLNGREIDEASAEAWIAEHLPFIEELAVAHDHDDATECLNALLEYQVRGRDETLMLGRILGAIKTLSGPDRNPANDGTGLKSYIAMIEPYGMKWEGNGVIVANSHRGLAEVFKGTQWEAGNWGDSLRRLPGAAATKQRRFAGEVRALATFIPAALIPDWDEPEFTF